MIQRSRVSKSGEQTDSLSVVIFGRGGGVGADMSHKMFICKFCWRKKRKKERELLVNGAEATVSLRLCIMRERERERGITEATA